MNDMIDELTEWFEAKKGQSLHIQKAEHSTGTDDVTDFDDVTISLEEVSLSQRSEEDPDGYVPNQELILMGNGHIQGEDRNMPLPQNRFEIPLYDNFQLSKDGEVVKIYTEKAVYRVSQS
ncbi:hypothetical protein [Halalkalibacterium ligniniphilum]|uniref:hypothetical protein n=1 Tax=Halalkalibacterium ligniniphilum TaxID=1134413 RepID=UPI0003494243|nr:hypothetical protein [Halalkalibacterium ligniniphilum]